MMASSLACSCTSMPVVAGQRPQQLLQRPAAPARCSFRAGMLSSRQLPPQQAATTSGRRGQLLVRASASASAEASTVKIIIQGRNIEVTPAIRDHIEQKISNAVSSFENVVKEVDVRLKVHGGDATKGAREQVAEVTVYTLRNGVVRVVDKEESLYAAVDKVSDKLTRNLRKLKEKALPKGKWPGHRATAKGGKNIVQVLDKEEVADSLPTDREAALPEEVLRTKYFLLEPLSAEEAVEQIQYLSHDFFLFQDKESGQVRCMYKRHSGGYGIIVPQLKQEQ